MQPQAVQAIRPTLSPVTGLLQRQCACGNHSSSNACEDCQKKANRVLNRTAASASQANGVPPIIHDVLRSPGQPLDTATRLLMEPHFGRDFSQVRVHTDAPAANSARAVHALAYTAGNNIVFGAGQYAPWNRTGHRLLAHELAHVAQENPMAHESEIDGVSDPADPAEVAADAAATRVMQGLPASVKLRHDAQRFIYRAPETWFRGEATGVAPSSPGGAIHDFGDGLYLTNDRSVAAQYASTRAGNQPSTGRVLTATFERSTLGRILDLTQDARWTRFIQTRLPSSELTYEQLIRQANENYWRFFQEFLRQNNLRLENFDTVIGPEYVRGGTQICIRNSEIAAQIRLLLRPVPAGAPSPEGGTASETSRPAAGEQQRPGSTPEVRSGNEPSTGAPSPPTEFRVQTRFRILNVITEAGNTVAEVEAILGEGLEALNRTVQANGERALPGRVLLRMTINPEGALIAAESTTSEATAFVETLARQALATVPRTAAAAEGAVGATGAEGAAGTVAAGAARVSPWVRGVGWAGLALFVGVTAYQYRQATPEQRPRVLTTAAGGFAGGALSGYVVCNLILGIETVGWSLLGCLFLAGIPGSLAGSAAADAAYDAATATPLQRALHDLMGQPDNVRQLFYAMVARATPSGGLPITEDFVSEFIISVPSDLAKDELAILINQLTNVIPGDTLGGVLRNLRGAIDRLPRRRPLVLPAQLDITDVLTRPSPFRLDAIGGRIRLLPSPRPQDLRLPPSPAQPAATTPLLEIEF